MSTKTPAAATPATYEEWLKLVDLHEAYDKHTLDADRPRVWNETKVCSVCGYVVDNDGKPLNSVYPLQIDGSLCRIPISVRRWVIRRLMPLVNKLEPERCIMWRNNGEIFKQLNSVELRYLVDTCDAPWAALQLVLSGHVSESLRAMCLRLPSTAYGFAARQGKANDEERRIISADADLACNYARHIDREYHVVTRMGAMRKPGTALTYLKEWGDSFTVTDKERKRMCRTMEGAAMLSSQDLQDRPEYKNRLSTSAYHGVKYLVDNMGEPDATFAYGTDFRQGNSSLVYMAMFDITAEQIRAGLEGNEQAYFHPGPESCMTANRAYKAYLECKTILAQMGRLDDNDVTSCKFRRRSVFAAGAILATRRCTPAMWDAVSKCRGYQMIIRTLKHWTERVNVTRLRKGLPIIPCDFSGVPAHN